MVGQIQPFFAKGRQKFTIVVERGIETGLEHLFGLWRRRPELENLERTELGNQLVEKRQQTLSRTGLAIILAPFALVISPRQVKQKLSLRCIWNIVLDLVFLEVPGDASGFRNEFADVAAVRIENLVFADEHVFQLEAIGFPKGLLEN